MAIKKICDRPLRSVGGSVMMAVPKSILDALGLSANEKVALRIENGALIVEPRQRPKYSLTELLAQCDPTADQNTDAQAWDGAEPTGREVL